MLIAPSILSLDFTKFNEQLSILNECTDWIHFDVMDGNFVPNISFGPKIFSTFRKHSNKFLDVHLMVTNPKYYLEKFAEVGADSITFHVECFDNLKQCEEVIDRIHELNIKAGISLKPDTDIRIIYPLLNKLDLVLIMSVEPGFGGQKFIESSYDKISALNKEKINNSYNFLIEVDGGVNDNNAYQLIECGVDVLVAGSFVFEGDIRNKIESLKRIKKS